MYAGFRVAVAEVILWRRKNVTLGILFVALAAWVVFEGSSYTLLSLVSSVLLLLAIVFLWTKSAEILNNGGDQHSSVVPTARPTVLREHDLPLVLYETGKGWSHDKRAARGARRDIAKGTQSVPNPNPAIAEGTQPISNPNPRTRKRAPPSSRPVIEALSGPSFAAWGYQSRMTEANLEGFRNLYQIPPFISLQLAEPDERSCTPRHEAMAV
ncbi:hypothetical protein NE237_005694 [Protea cynaroides]|uniref:Reticulon-like protein n=1 Tax=Protea cynaroides TaxID=273540 RepID=A0A9Q0QUG4_9MAGN|nr:hypothetical protein NE237_005694 [Protea cynaroides]